MENLLNVIATFTGIPIDDIKKNAVGEGDKLNDIGATYIGDLLKAKVNKHIVDPKLKDEEIQNYQKKGFKEAMELANSKLAEVYPDAEIGKEMKLDEVISKIKEKQITPLKDDDVKLHQVYRDLERSSIPFSEHETLKTEFEGFKKGIERKQTFNTLKKIAIERLEKYKLPDDKKALDNRVEAFIDHTFGGFDFDPEKGGKDYILIKDGKRYEDENLNAVTATKRIDQQAPIMFDLKVAGKATGEDQKDNLSPPPTKDVAPTTLEEFNLIRAGIKDNKELVEFNNKYKGKF